MSQDIRGRLAYITKLVDEAIGYWEASNLEDAAGAMEEVTSESKMVIGELDSLLDDGKP